MKIGRKTIFYAFVLVFASVCGISFVRAAGSSKKEVIHRFDVSTEQGISAEELRSLWYHDINYDEYGFNDEGYDRRGFDKNGVCKYTHTQYDQWGYDAYGYDEKGIDVGGFDRNYIHKDTGTVFSPKKHDVDGYSKKGVFESAYAVFRLNGFCNADGYNRKGFNKREIHKDTGTKYDSDGFDVHGFDKNGIHRLTHTQWSPGDFDFKGFRIDRFNVFTGSYRGPDGRYR